MNQEWLYPHRDAKAHKNRYNDTVDATNGNRYKEIRLTKEMLTKHPYFTVDATSEIDLEEQELLHQRNIIRNKLLARLYELAEEHLTPHQKMIFALYTANRNMTDIATIMGMNYTGVPHALFGIPQKRADGRIRMTGGIVPKLKKLVESDRTSIDLAQELRDTMHSVTIVTHQEKQLIEIY